MGRGVPADGQPGRTHRSGDRYWFIFVLFHVLLRRNVGAIGIADVLLQVLIADAAQNATAGEYERRECEFASE